MKIIKRSGMEVEFDRSKINNAVKKANNSVVLQDQMSDEQIEEIAKNVEIICEGMGRALSVEEIQDLVENQIMNQKAFRVASNYITYRYKRALVRKSNSTDKQRSARISQNVSFCRNISWKLTNRVSYISMIPIILPSTCITAAW